MPPSPPIPSQSFGRTFIVAAALLGAVALAQFGAMGWAFFKKKPQTAVASAVPEPEPARRPPEKIDVSRLVVDAPPPAEEPLDAIVDPLDERPPAEGRPPLLKPIPPPATSAAPEPAKPEVAASPTMPARPTPVPLSAFTPKVDPRFNQLVEEAKLLRNNGDTAGALVKFREAAALEPANPLPIAETAYTFEKMTLPDKAAEQWRRVLAMGEGAGVYFSAAKSKLDDAMAVAKGAPPGEIAEGRTLALGAPRVFDDSDPASAKKFTLSVPIRARAGAKVNVREMKVFVLFYERLNGKDIVRTAANVSNGWGSPPADWEEGDTETLEVRYDLPPPEAGGDRRDYHGYVVRLYYKGDLQDSQAEPAALNQKFPAPTQLSE